jgi:hypothetical protein
MLSDWDCKILAEWEGFEITVADENMQVIDFTNG